MEADAASVPQEWNSRNVRACVACHLIKTFDQFYDAGCENCAFLDMEQNKDRVLEATTTNFSGMCASTDPEGSWVSRWVGTSTMVPGVYAVQATATEMSEELEQLLEANGVQLKE